MIFDKIIHGTQYYRAPTPLPEEWESDIANFENYGIDCMQIRINWRWNERKEGEYDFSDVDRLMELARKYNRKVIIKFLLECAPQYVFDKYGGTRIGPRGEQLRGGSHGAFYGGWRPCFTNPDVQAAAIKFVEKVAERYKDHPSLMLWNAWNEIRNKPMEDCFCTHCRSAYGRYLKKKFGTVEALNDFYKTAEDSFETIALPSTPQGFWDTFEFKKFKGGDNLYEYLRFVYDAIKKHDTVHPVMSHVGFAAAFQTNIGDVCDDYSVSRAVDFFGTSIPCECAMDTEEKRLDFMLLNDYMRSVDKNYFVHEIYPGLGMFKYEYDTPHDMSYKLYTALSSGAKGLVYWQYRAERVGHENDCAGIMRADGSPREVAYAVQAFSRDLNKNMKYFTDAEANGAEVAIVFDFNSMLLSEIEDCCGPDFRFELNNPVYYYLKSHTGMYRLLRENDYSVDYIHTADTDKFGNYKVLYFPYYNIFDPAIVVALKDFLENGGTVIADEGFGLRELNTWMQPYDIECAPIMQARLRERRRCSVQLSTPYGEISASPYKSEYAIKDAETLISFNDGTPAIQSVKCGRGRVIVSGISIGYSSYDSRSDAMSRFICDVLSAAGVERCAFSNFKKGIYEKRLVSDKYETVFIFNSSPDKVTVIPSGEPVTLGADAAISDGGVTVPAMGIGYFATRRKDS